MLRRSSVFSITFALLLGIAGCKSGEGERCQLDSDCEEGLVCADSTGTCVTSVSGQVDGGIDAPNDASEVDATEIDATPIDAMEIDAAIDAP